MTVSVSELKFVPENMSFPSPADWRDLFIYFLLVDRFDDNESNTPPYDPTEPASGRDPAAGKVFQGGKLKGITRRLDYIKGLGANAVWLSPIFKNRQEFNHTYHGYGIQNFLEVDPRFGTKEDLKELVKAAHEKGMYVILDIIFNHTGDNWAYPGNFPYYFWKEDPGPFDFGFWREADPAPGLQEDDAVWPVEFQHPECYKRRGQITDWNDPDQALNGDFLTLKELDINRPDVLDALVKSYKHWICEADIDGFRVDTVKHMESGSTAILCNALREYAKSIGKQNFFIFGEIVDEDRIIEEYIGRNSRLPGTNERYPSLDAALDFPLYFVLEEVLKGFGNSQSIRDRYDRFHTHYADHGAAGKNFVTFVDNHDQMTRKYRRFMHGNPHTKQAILAMGYLLTSQGIPCIYYGTEQGFDGGGDHDSYVRECMFGGKWGAFDTTGRHFFNPEHAVYQGIAEIARVRSLEPALRYGRQYFREISGNGIDFGYPLDGKCILAFSRVLDTTEILVVLNLDESPRSEYVTVDVNLSPEGKRMVDLLSAGRSYTVERRGERCAVRVDLEGHGMAVLKVGQGESYLR